MSGFFQRGMVLALFLSVGLLTAYGAQAGITFPGQFEFNSNCDYVWQQKISATDNSPAVLHWNAWLDKRMVKNTLTFRFLVNDILDQNVGFSRSISANQLTETSFTSLRRYWMLSVIWNFVSRGKKGS